MCGCMCESACAECFFIRLNLMIAKPCAFALVSETEIKKLKMKRPKGKGILMFNTKRKY